MYKFKWNVFLISIFLCGSIAVWGIVSPSGMTGTVKSITAFAIYSLDWFFLLLCTFLVFLAAYLAFGKYSHMKLGKDDDEPEFSLVSWLAMLFASGMGAGLLFWGVAEPVFIYMKPPGIEGQTAQAARYAMVLTNFHWGIHAWSIYAISGAIIAYFLYRKGTPCSLSAPINYTWNWKFSSLISGTVDIIAGLSVVFGLAASLAMGLLQLKSGIDVAFPNNFNSQTVLIVLGLIVGISFTVSTVSGLDKGIKALSNLNTILVILLLIYVIFFGPTLFIFQTFINSIGDYASSLLEVSFKLLPYQGLTEWTDNWTLMFLIWWIALGPCVGIFIARISKGRTLREYMLAVVLIPTIFSVLWFAAFGGSGLYIELFGQGGIGSLVMESYSKALFELFEYFPLSQFLDVLTLFLIFIFLVTTAQAGCFVISMISAGGITNPPTLSKLVWAIVIILISLGTVLSGGIEVAKAIAVSGAILFSAVLIVLIATFLLVIRKEDTRRFHVKKK